MNCVGINDEKKMNWSRDEERERESNKFTTATFDSEKNVEQEEIVIKISSDGERNEIRKKYFFHFENDDDDDHGDEDGEREEARIVTALFIHFATLSIHFFTPLYPFLSIHSVNKITFNFVPLYLHPLFISLSLSFRLKRLLSRNEIFSNFK